MLYKSATDIKASAIYRVFYLRFLGNFLIFLSLFFVAKTFITPISAEIRYFYDNSVAHKNYTLAQEYVDGAAEEKDTPKYELSESSQLASFFSGFNEKSAIVPIDTDFSVVIPKIAANAKIIKNVDSSNEEEYLQSLKLGVAHASGTRFPGEGGNVFLFAHSTDYIWNISNYNAVFYLLYKLEKDDEINIFYEGKRFVYVVEGSKTVAPNEVEYLVNTTPDERLTLQTCWPPGTTLQRLLVFARRKAI